MPYYMAGDYYRAGDYYAAGGIFSSIGRAIGKVAKVAGGLLPGPLGTIARIGGGILTGAAVGRTIASAINPMDAPPGQQLPVPGLGGAIERFLPGGETGYFKKPRMNVANPKALRRALRRVAGFGKLARRARRDIGRAASAVGVRRGVVKARRR